LPNRAKTGDSLLDALNNTIAVAAAAYENFQAAIGNPMEQGSALALHNHAIDQQFKAEKAYREEQERRGILVPQQQIIERCRHAMDQVLRALKKLPTESGPHCNPTNALLAKNILERAVNKIIAVGFGAMRDI
jgi:hypothetical protein